MSTKPPPPAPPSCLMRPYSSKPRQKGGTLIAEDVLDLATHLERILDPDGYRPERCPRCGHDCLHVHDYRLRMPRDRPRGSPITIGRYACAVEDCGACWQVLPAFLARHLQRAWETIEWAALPDAVAAPVTTTTAGASGPPPVPPSTLRRYRSRLSSCASALRAALAAIGAGVDAVLSRLGVFVTRAQFCRALAQGGVLDPARRLAQLAGYLHRLVPGLRLM